MLALYAIAPVPTPATPTPATVSYTDLFDLLTRWLVNLIGSHPRIVVGMALWWIVINCVILFFRGKYRGRTMPPNIEGMCEALAWMVGFMTPWWAKRLEPPKEEGS